MSREHYFHFPSRTANSAANLTGLARNWLRDTFDETGQAFVTPQPVPIEGETPRAAISLGVGGNDTKRIGGDFETGLIRSLGERFRTLWIDRGVGGEEAAASPPRSRVPAWLGGSLWEGSFAGFVSIISQCDLLCRIRFRRPACGCGARNPAGHVSSPARPRNVFGNAGTPAGVRGTMPFTFMKPNGHRKTEGRSGRQIQAEKEEAGRYLRHDETHAAKAMPSHVEKLAALHDLLYAEHKRALLIVLQGMDAAGKDGTIKHVMSGVNPQGCTVTVQGSPPRRNSITTFSGASMRPCPHRAPSASSIARTMKTC